MTKGKVEWMTEGIAEGMAKGGKAAKVKIAANLLSLGVPMKTIMQASGLSEEEIKSIKHPMDYHKNTWSNATKTTNKTHQKLQMKYSESYKWSAAKVSSKLPQKLATKQRNS